MGFVREFHADHAQRFGHDLQSYRRAAPAGFACGAFDLSQETISDQFGGERGDRAWADI